MEICSDHQVVAGCFDHLKDCIKTCENKTDPGCWDAGMWGFVRECPVPRLSPPRVNEGWSNSHQLSHDINRQSPKASVKADLKSSLGIATAWVLGIILFFLILCLIVNRIVDGRK
jgi:hypothetical protein